MPPEETALNRPAAAQAWRLDPEIIFLNHGSFGACPQRVLVRELEQELDAAREKPAHFIGTDYGPAASNDGGDCFGSLPQGDGLSVRTKSNVAPSASACHSIHGLP